MVGQPASEVHAVQQSRLRQGLAGAVRRTADHDQLAPRARVHSGQCPDQHVESLERDVRAGDCDDAAVHPPHPLRLRGDEGVDVDADRHHPHPGRRDAEVAFDVLRGVARYGQQVPAAPGDPGLHLHEAVPATLGHLLPAARGGQLQSAVPADRVVDRREQRKPTAFQIEDARGEGLVVVQDVEVLEPPAQQPGQPRAEHPRLRETTAAHDQVLQDVQVRVELARMWAMEAVRVPVEVQARHPGQRDTRIEIGVRRAAEHLDAVPQGDQLSGQVAHVHALPARVRLGAV